MPVVNVQHKHNSVDFRKILENCNDKQYMQISRAIMMGFGIFIRRVREARIGRAGGRRAPIGKCDVILRQ